MTVGVLVGSAAWWLFLSNVVGLLRGRVTSAWMQQVNRISGAIIVGFAVFILPMTLSSLRCLFTGNKSARGLCPAQMLAAVESDHLSRHRRRFKDEAHRGRDFFRRGAML